MSSRGSMTVVLITGANTGLGFEIAKALFARPSPYHILIGCRGDLGRAHDAISKLKQSSPDSPSIAEPLSIDITSDESITAAFKQVQDQFGHVDVLVNNAGADFDTAVSSSQLTKREGWNQTYNVNVTGTHLFTEALAPLLLASQARPPRLLFITSGLSSCTELATGSSPRYTLAPAGWPKPNTMWFSYRVSKSGMNMMATEWSRLMRNDGVRVFNISPGFLNTGLGDDRATGEWRDKSSMGAIDPAIGAGFCADVVEGKRDEQAWPIKVLRKDMVQPW
ncbi:NAD(P)-binding protein [Whalleya microplaca]|nr:NAD(P)-binding protein [Whalleya microplaca]